ncbi:hypothetical protein Acr_07g0010950 [Actinidia rufa]|uniref:Uncharacterized protein n=1 Tax=Actinidia rufa TaxID=165716 RepID=A0A7J0EY60_9ERIC|nr:hypothetical protein Acr_07g0010950 [Actinidia rufa]
MKDKVVDDLIRYELDEPSSSYFFLVGLNMKERERIELIEFQKANIEAFTWTPYEMPGIDPNFIRKEINVILEARSMKQRVASSTTSFPIASFRSDSKVLVTLRPS